MTVEIPDKYDSKFLFVNVAAARAKQLQAGAPPKIPGRGKSTTIAIREVEANLISFRILEAGSNSP